ncbi:phosphomannomutase [Gluconobacter aidae]|nr:phosphomannomutase [Gluconobacter aidae]
MVQSEVAFGTSGARGLVTSMTDAVCFAYTVGYLMYLETVGEFSAGMPVAIAGDLRPSTPRILRACAAAIVWMKGKPVYCGQVPTPALSLYAFSQHVPSLMVTGSHIPSDRNGIKFNRARGEFLKTDEAIMREQDVNLPHGWFDDQGALTTDITLPPITDVLSQYIARYVEFFGRTALSGKTLGVYQHSAVGRDVLVSVIEALGGKAVPLGRSDVFVSVDTEAVRPEDIVLARDWAQNGEYDAILTTDGDSDRPLLTDQYGHWIRGDVLGILAAQSLDAASVTTPVSSNTALEASGIVSSVCRTRIGSPYVVTGMMDAVKAGNIPSVGYEANGGFLLASDISRQGKFLAALPTRDAVLPMICVLTSVQDRQRGVAGLLEALPPRFTQSDRLQDIPGKQSAARLAILREDVAGVSEALGFVAACGSVANVDETDGIRITFQKGDIIHLRPSGNAPELRVYVEASTPQRAGELLTLGMTAVDRWMR